MKRRILTGLVAFVALFVVTVASEPPNYRVTRQFEIDAPPEAIFPLLHDAKKAQQWMPGKKVDPTLKVTYSGQTAGVGAKTIWSQNRGWERGETTIVQSVPNERVVMRIDHRRPLLRTEIAEIALTPMGKTTMVRWTVAGKNLLPERILCFFVDLDQKLGRRLELGLNRLTQIVARPARRPRKVATAQIRSSVPPRFEA